MKTNGELRARICSLEIQLDRCQREIEQQREEFLSKGAKATNMLCDADARIAELERQLENERIRLSACGSAALGYFEGCKAEYKSASLDDVLRLRERADSLERQQAVLVEALTGVVLEVESLIDESEGLTGFHLNGDIAPWSEIVAGGRFERLTSIPCAHAALAAVKGDSDGKN